MMRKLFKLGIKFSYLWMLIFASSVPLSAQTAAAVIDKSSANTIDYITMIELILIAFILLTLLFIINTLRTFIDFNSNKPKEETVPLLSGIMQKLSGAVPVENEASILTDHHYDGIRELDNDLPLWWKYMFYATIVFAFAYIYYYHFSSYQESQAAEYEKEIVTAKLEIEAYTKTVANRIDENNVVLATAKGIESGKAIFLQSCVACHGAAGEGGVGPNLTDEYWIHGGNIKNIFKTIKYGVPQKGMIPWKAQLSPLQMQGVATYILTLKDTNPANPKAPQGDKVEDKKDL